MIVDFKPAVDALFGAVGPAIVTILVPWLAVRALQLMHVARTSALSQIVLQAAENGAHLGLAKAQAYADVHASVDLAGARQAVAAEYVAQAVPGAIQRLGLTAEHVDAIVAAQLAKATNPLPQPVTQGAPA